MIVNNVNNLNSRKTVINIHKRTNRVKAIENVMPSVVIKYNSSEQK